MKLAVFLAIGETWEEFILRGQDDLFLNQNLRQYKKKFSKIYVFHYGRLARTLEEGIILVANDYSFHRFVYCLVFPILHRRKIAECNIIRGMQLTSGIPIFMSTVISNCKSIINYGYDYEKVARIEGKIIQTLMLKFLKYLLLNCVSAVIVTTSALKNSVKKITSKPVYLVPNGINTQLFSPKRVHKNVDILCVGRLVEQKNYIYLLHALSKIKHKIKLIQIIGNGGLYDTIEKIAQQNKLNIKIISKIPHSLLPTAYNQSKIFIMPSKIEGHPKALLEAMSCGCVVLGNDVEGISSIIKHGKNGYLFSNEQDLTSLVLKILDNTKAQRFLSKNARRYILRNFDLVKTSRIETNLLRMYAIA